MTYKDAKELLRIADNAFNAGAYVESAEIVEKLAYFVANRKDNGLSAKQSDEITKTVKQAIGRFTFCPDESVWEEACGLMDLFGDDV